LAIGSFALYGVLTLVSFRTLDDAGQATVAEVADLVDRDRLPDPIPVTGSQIVQVLDSDNRVLSASVNGDRLTALLTREEVAAALQGRPPRRSPDRGWGSTRRCASPPPKRDRQMPVVRSSSRSASTTSRTASASSGSPCWPRTRCSCSYWP
jgi:hypothetical protein